MKISWYKRKVLGIVFEKKLNNSYFNVFRRYKNGIWKFGVWVSGLGGSDTSWHTENEAFKEDFFLEELTRVNPPTELLDELIIKYKNYHKRLKEHQKEFNKRLKKNHKENSQ